MTNNDQYSQNLINAFPDPVMIINIDDGRRVSMVNDSLLAMSGAAHTDIIGKPCFSILHGLSSPCSPPLFSCPYEEVLKSGKRISCTHNSITALNRETVLEVIASPIRDREGRIVRIIEVIRNVTEESRLKEETRQSVDFLGGVLDGIGEGVVMMDREYHILAANKGYLHQTGKTLKEVIGKHCYEVSHHFDSHCLENGHHCPVKTVFDTANKARAIHTHYDSNNHAVHVECHAYPIRDETGAVVRAIETISDVTERVLLEQKLKESEEKYRNLYNNAPDGYYSLDGNSLVIEVNRTFLEMLGYRREEVVEEKFIKDLVTKESADICLMKFPELKKTGRIMNVELTMRKKDGDLLPVTMNATAVYDADGAFLMSRSVIRDISDKKRSDEEMHRLQSQLFQSQKLEALGTLAGGVAHDFNNLLASILGYASLAKSDLSKEDAPYQHLEIIENASVRASELTQQLLAFAKGGKYNPKPNDANAIVHEVVALLSRTIDKKITITADREQNLQAALCDAGQIQQALLNICINARDAMPNGGTIRISTENIHLDIKDVQFFVDVPPGNYVLISVADTGLGMDRDTREHIFEPFFTTKSQGTGLGLSLVYGTVKKHNGFIQVSSEPGKGSLFQVYLPACETTEVCVKKGEKLDLRRGSEMVLVVDDEPMITDLAREILRRYGYRVLTAGGGQEAIEVYRKQPEKIAAVILDMIMPDMDGRAVFTRLHEINPGVKIIASSGYGDERDANDLLKKGAAGFVQKPYRISELIRVVGNAVGGQA